MARGADLPAGVVTLVFTDIEGSTALLHELGDRYRSVLDDHDRLLRDVWAQHGGVEVLTEGDAFFVAFDRASDAVAAVRAAQRALAAHPWPDGRALRVRMGVHTGEPQPRDTTYWGIDVHYAARLCSAAHGGQVLVSAATRALLPDLEVDDLGEHALKDFAAGRRLFHLVIDGQRSDAFAPPRTLQAARTNLPSATATLIGRDAEVAELARRLTRTPERLVTLTGAGGSGKTRVAMGVGAALLHAFADGVFLVSLAPVPEAGGVASALADTFGVTRHPRGPEEGLIDHLRDKELLLIVDNFEHVLDAAMLIGRLLDHAPGMRLLVTSQTPLRLAAESVIPLEPLVVPDRGSDEPDALAAVPAVAMFADRARAADPSFALTGANAGAVAELCRRLDGLPLALELAAARVRMAGIDGLLSALSRGIDALGRGHRDLPARQRGLQAALDWTVSLLSDEQRAMFAGLGVFAEAWTIEHAERLFGDELDVWEAMGTLMDFSLVHTRGDGRLTMAERVRTHARALLAQSGRDRELRRAHAELMAEIAEALDLDQPLDQDATVARTLDFVDELEYALRFSRAADPDLHRRLIGASGRILWFVGRLPGVADDVLALSEGEQGHDAVAGRVLRSRAMYECLCGDMTAAAAWTGRSVDVHRQTGDRELLVSSIATHAHMLTLASDGPAARAAIGEGLELATGERARFRDLLEGTLAFAALAEGSLDEAQERLMAMIAVPSRTDFAAAAASSYLGDLAVARGDGASAVSRYLDNLEEVARQGDINNSVMQLVGIAAGLTLLHRYDEAGVVAAAARRLATQAGMASDFETLPFVGGHLAALLRELGPERWAVACERGEAIDLAGAVAYARELAAQVAVVGPPR